MVSVHSCYYNRIPDIRQFLRNRNVSCSNLFCIMIYSCFVFMRQKGQKSLKCSLKLILSSNNNLQETNPHDFLLIFIKNYLFVCERVCVLVCVYVQTNHSTHVEVIGQYCESVPIFHPYLGPSELTEALRFIE